MPVFLTQQDHIGLRVAPFSQASTSLTRRTSTSSLPKCWTLACESQRKYCNSLAAKVCLVRRMLYDPLLTHMSEDLEAMCSAYFDTVNACLPIICKKRFLGGLEAFDTTSHASLALLLLSMKLLMQYPDPDEGPRNSIYWTCRQFYAQVEDMPLLSLGLLQAKILIALYEIGHGIFPAGCLSVAHAARLGKLMGLHDRKRATQLFKPTATWSGREEERRVWWAVLILDR